MLARRTRNSWRILLRRTLLFIIFVLMILATVFILKNSIPPTKDNNTAVITVIEKQKVTIGLPIRLKIPTINVDATVYYVGLTSDGTMDIAKDPDKVAWYEFGPHPGEIGSAVIAGHYGWIGDKGSIFNDIHTLKKGDELSVTDEKGTVIVFVMREIREYNPESDATTVFKSNDGKSHLNLITCNGVYENDKQSYSNRLVVFTDKKT